MHRFCNYIWKWCIDRVPGDKREEWISEMNAPLPGRKRIRQKPSQAEIEQEGESFMAAMQTLGGGG